MNQEIVSHEERRAARRALLAKEKEFTRFGDEMSRQVRELPWEAVTKEYLFDGSDGRQSPAGLFEGRSELVVYHFMFHPDDKVGCPHCSLRACGFNGIGVHLNQRDVTMVVVSGSPSHAAMWERGHLILFKASLEWLSKGTVNGKQDGVFQMGIVAK